MRGEGELQSVAGAFPAETLDVFGKCSHRDRRADLAHQHLVVKQIVQGVEARAEDFAGAVQVMQTCMAPKFAAWASFGAVVSIRPLLTTRPITILKLAHSRTDKRCINANDMEKLQYFA